MTQISQTFSPHEVQPVYASGTEIHLKPADITILFKREVFGTGSEPKKMHETVISGVVLSPVAAKRLSEVLNKVVSDYEQHVGPITAKGTKVKRAGDISDLDK